MQTIALDIEVQDNRPEYADRAPWSVMGSDVMMYLDGRWSAARTQREIVEQARNIARRYRGESDYTLTLVGYAVLGKSWNSTIDMGRIEL